MLVGANLYESWGLGTKASDIYVPVTPVADALFDAPLELSC